MAEVIFDLGKIGSEFTDDKNVLNKLKSYEYTLDTDDLSNYHYSYQSDVEDKKITITDVYDEEVGEIYEEIYEECSNHMYENLKKWLNGEESEVDFDYWDDVDKSKTLDENLEIVGDYENITSYYAVFDYDLMSIIAYTIYNAVTESIEEIEKDIDDEISTIGSKIYDKYDDIDPNYTDRENDIASFILGYSEVEDFSDMEWKAILDFCNPNDRLLNLALKLQTAV
ncbi:MAG: hypothetical protein B6229_00455 [Spirochaetaceae bacterium 4572_7]|nr:MAG: hypothetical protein B6229_00455 [Spirochaetaceae bacterium 4572_7]